MVLGEEGREGTCKSLTYVDNWDRKGFYNAESRSFGGIRWLTIGLSGAVHVACIVSVLLNRTEKMTT